jgi:hypothetical protein
VSEPPLYFNVEPEAVKSRGAEPCIGKIVGPSTKAAAETRQVSWALPRQRLARSACGVSNEYPSILMPENKRAEIMEIFVQCAQGSHIGKVWLSVKG